MNLRFHLVVSDVDGNEDFMCKSVGAKMWVQITDMPTLRKLKEGDSLSSVSSGRPTIVGPEGQRKF